MGRQLTVRDIIDRLASWAPEWTAESWDNSGLQVGRPDWPVAAGLVSLDLTPQVIEEAAALGAQLIVTHHPIFFEPIKAITPATLVGSMALSLAERGIAHYAIHTNLDVAVDGVSFALARQLGLRDIQFLQTRPGDLSRPELDTGVGAVGLLPAPMPAERFLGHVVRSLGVPAVRHVLAEREVAKVAVCGGSGNAFLAAALEAEADAYVTADVKYHQFFDALSPDGVARITYVDAGHYETEMVTERILIDYLRKHCGSVSWHRTETRTGPIRTHVGPGMEG